MTTSAGRSARHVALPQVGKKGQALIDGSTVLLIGVGGIGCAAAAYLASSSCARLLLSDFDTVDSTNLGRQILFGPDDVGKQKVDAAGATLSTVNPDICIEKYPDRLSGAALSEAIARADVVLDGSDNFTTRFMVSDACVAAGTCLISGSAIRLEGQLAVFGPNYADSPCYRCLYREADESLDNCSGNGVLAPVPGVIGTMMATEALKYLAGLKTTTGILHLYDAATPEWRAINIKKRDDCPGCSKNGDILN